MPQDQIWNNEPGSDRSADRWNRILPFKDWLTREGYTTYGYATYANPTAINKEVFSLNIVEENHGFILGLRITNTGSNTIYYSTAHKKLSTDPWSTYDVVSVKAQDTRIIPYYFRLYGNVFFQVAILANGINDGVSYVTMDYAQVPSALINRGWEYPNNP